MYHIEQISAEETYPVRHPVLREGRPISDCVFEADNDEGTFHLGLFFNSTLVGVASYMKNKSAFFSEENQYQLRGMAVLKDYQKKGLGKLLLFEGEHLLVEKNVNLLWFNAREIAVDFYNNNGHQIIGKAFKIPQVGLHYVMFKKLS